MARARDHDRGFAAFAIDGFLTAFGFVLWPLLVVGLALMPIAFRRYESPADLGLFTGVGLVAIFVAASGVDHAGIWAAAGTALAVTSTFAFWWLRCRPARSRA